MTFQQTELAFLPGLFSNRSRRASKQRWVDGNLVRFSDQVPAQVGGWRKIVPSAGAVVGLARGILSWRPNNQAGRFLVIGTDQGAFLYDSDQVMTITPADFVPGQGGTVIGDGYGSDRYGIGDYGTPRASTGNTLEATNWTFDMFGETLIACCSTDGVIYEFTADTDTRLFPIVGAPRARAICVTNERHVMAFGVDGVPGRVEWSDREDRSDWDPTDTNRAGGYDVQVRSPFQCGKRVAGQILGWTKTEVFAFAPLNNALVYSNDKISTEAGAVGPNAVAVKTDGGGESAYWFGRNNFFIYEGYVRVLDCELHDYVFQNINQLQEAKFHTRINAAFDEVWFWYCSAASDEIDRAVTFCFRTNTWSKASVARLSWEDSGVFEKPIAVAADGALYEHEIGATADGAPMPSFVTSHPITIGVGQQFADLDQFWPDMQEGSAGCSVSFLTRGAPGQAALPYGPYPFVITDEFVPLTISCREFQVRIDGGNGAWELGLPLISMQGGSLK